MPKVSVIVPTYNRAHFIGQTLDSVFAQTYPDFEVIVVDDGSTDDTQAVLAKYDGITRYIYQENKGQAAARNTGLGAARGDYILLLDSDDILVPNKLERHISRLDARPDFGLVYSGWQHIDEDGVILGEVRPNREGNLLKDMLRHRFVLGTTGVAVVRRECFERAGPFDEYLRGGDDADMWLRIAKAGYSFGCIEQPLIQYRIHQEGLYSSVAPDDVQYRFASLDKFFADPGLPEDIRALEAEAYAILHYGTAIRYYRANEIDLAQGHLRQAISTHPRLSLDKEWLLEWITGVVTDPRTTSPLSLINLILDNLPTEAATLRSLRRRARGRYHIASMFAEYQAHRLGNIRKHILPALIGDPIIVRNRGFISITLRSFFDSGGEPKRAVQRTQALVKAPEPKRDNLQ